MCFTINRNFLSASNLDFIIIKSIYYVTAFIAHSNIHDGPILQKQSTIKISQKRSMTHVRLGCKYAFIPHIITEIFKIKVKYCTALLCYTFLISVQKLMQMIKLNTTDALSIQTQQENRPTSYRKY